MRRSGEGSLGRGSSCYKAPGTAAAVAVCEGAAVGQERVGHRSEPWS